MNFKPILLSPLGLLPLAAGQAEANDNVRPRTPVADPYSPLWTGFYGGVHVGGINARSSLGSYRPGGPAANYCWANNCAFSSNQNALGVLAGIQFGYSFQIQQTVFGIETDFSYSSASKSATGQFRNNLFEPWSAETGVDAFGTTRLRFGYAFDRALVYATGGVAYASMRDNFLGSTGTPGGVPYSTSKAGWRFGWTAGLGAEYSIARNWSVKAEGLYYDMGTTNHVSTDTFSQIGLYERMTGVIARVGLNYQFR